MNFLRLLGLSRLNRRARLHSRPLAQPIGVDPMTRRAIDFGGAAELNLLNPELYGPLAARDRRLGS